MKPYEYLANAIVLQAIDDYEFSLAVLSTEYPPHKDRKEEFEVATRKVKAKRMKLDCERFFDSKWFDVLSCLSDPTVKYKIIDNIVTGTRNAKPPVYNETAKKYICICGYPLAVKRNAKVTGRPVIKCSNCKRYWRTFGKAIVD